MITITDLGYIVAAVLSFISIIIGFILGHIRFIKKQKHERWRQIQSQNHEKEMVILNKKDTKEIIEYLKETSYIVQKDMLECEHGKCYEKKWKKLRNNRGDKNE